MVGAAPTPGWPPGRRGSAPAGDRGRHRDADQPAPRARCRRLRAHPPPAAAEPTYLPLGSTAHKQGRVAGATAAGHPAAFAGSLGTQVVKVFDLVAARTGLRDAQAVEGGHQPLTVTSRADDHKAYYPGATPIAMRCTGDRRTGRLLGVQLVGRRTAEIAKRVDVAAAACSPG